MRSLALRTDEVELGSWTREEAEISVVGEGRFELRAEGDRLDFVPDDPDALSGVLEPPEKPSRRMRRRKTEALGPPEKPSVRSRRRKQQAPARADIEAPKAKRESRWIRTLDRARPYSVFGLDRVPVDLALRGTDHTHTWDHRAAAPSGPSKHICTVCGKIRLRNRSAE